MKDDLVDVGLIGDAVAVAAICQEVGAGGALLVCNDCRNIEALIAGILVIDKDKEAWALCGTCIRKASQEPSHVCPARLLDNAKRLPHLIRHRSKLIII
jgi:hypothetical protein